MEYLKTDAVFSPCERYRYTLERVWDESLPKIAFLCLNPSTADALVDDPTVRRCVGYASDWGYGTFFMLNIFAFRATDPKDMKNAMYATGADNNMWIRTISKEVKMVVAAWGTHGAYKKRDREILSIFADQKLFCLERTKAGQPKHPLYLKKDLTPIPFNF